MPRIHLVLPFLLGACLLNAQDEPNPPAKPEASKAAAPAPLPESAKLNADIRASYYHPDDLPGLNCSVSLDWPGFFKALQMDPPPEKLKAMQGLVVRARAPRAKAAKLTFEWAGGQPPDGGDQLESGLKKMVSGFYQVYWPMIASSPVTRGTQFYKVEPLDGGTRKAYASDAKSKTEITLDKDSTPTHYMVDSNGMKVSMDPTYVASPKPVAGDLRRITGLNLAEQFGTSNINLEFKLDYQDVDGFYIPRHATFSVVGAWAIAMEFKDCSAMNGIEADNVDEGPGN